jgi:chromosome partitioning protein
MIISIANQKGGTGKTSSVINIGAGLAQLGKNVLLIDLDPQIDLSESLGITEGQSEYTINDVINKKVDINKAIMNFDNGLNVIPGSHKLTETTIKLKVNNRLKEILKDINDDYNYILIDTAPSLTILTVNSFVTSHEIWISFQPEWLATTGIKNILDTVKLLKDKLNINPNIRVIVNMYDQRKLLHRESVGLIKKHFDNVFSTMIRTNVSVAEAPGNHKTIFDYDPNSHGAIDYMALCKEIERKVK